ncbi:MAG TPA: alpha/beta fold hydrolase [Bradyrhizobium sp.]|jgi:poly(3-hydroxyalkanoate) synthetase|uniref:alpha/beta fold hydrolase n=1 Tax=Bradyrhizobium sp. TaxID=376 RepID=UPI002C3F8C63|nr:alpha/beta fold hydrolase [Bradyrhizobium sp.]HXB77664.1 alpha/beta fold hydrolase [Bradyrhizobium sp.]
MSESDEHGPASDRPSALEVFLAWPLAAASHIAQTNIRLFETFLPPANPRPSRQLIFPWASPNTISLELGTMSLRNFSTRNDGRATLICAPYALHGATIADFATGHSVVEKLGQCGLSRLFLTEWRSATADMRYFTIDNYLADLNVAVDELVPPVDLIGLCQGGWLALVYAARFPNKVRRLVLVGAPVDIAAAKSSLSNFAADVPLGSFHELVRLGKGIVHGQQMLGLWGISHGPNEADATLQAGEAIEPPEREALVERFRQWHAETVDLPGSFFLQVVEWLFKDNRIAEGRFVALGQTVDLSKLTAPIYLLAGSDDEVVAVDQLFAAARLVGTRGEHVVKMIETCGHLSLFLGTEVLGRAWPDVAGFLLRDFNEPQAIAERKDAPAVGGRSIRKSIG